MRLGGYREQQSRSYDPLKGSRIDFFRGERDHPCTRSEVHMPRVAIAIDAIMSMSHARRSGLLVITRTIGAFGATCIPGNPSIMFTIGAPALMAGADEALMPVE